MFGTVYADNGMVGLRNPEWLKGSLNVLIGLFRRYGLVINVANSKDMTCQTGSVRSGMSGEAVV